MAKKDFDMKEYINDFYDREVYTDGYGLYERKAPNEKSIKKVTKKPKKKESVPSKTKKDIKKQNKKTNTKTNNAKKKKTTTKKKNRKTKINFKRVLVIFIAIILLIFMIWYLDDSKKIKIVIDPGHGGNDTGALNDPVCEKDDNLELALAIKSNLKGEKNIKVIMTRDEDEFVDLKDRCKIANRNRADVFISVHRNDSPIGNGVEIWLPSNPSENETKLAESILTRLSDSSISRNRGVKEGTAANGASNYYVNGNTKCDSMVIEVGFVSSTLDNTLFQQNYLDYAKKISEGILDNVYLMYDKENK